jgi:hypothetical protein
MPSSTVAPTVKLGELVHKFSVPDGTCEAAFVATVGGTPPNEPGPRINVGVVGSTGLDLNVRFDPTAERLSYSAFVPASDPRSRRNPTWHRECPYGR